MTTAVADRFALALPAVAPPGPRVDGLPGAGLYPGLFGTLVAFATLLGIVLAAALLLQAGFGYATAEHDQQARRRSLALVRRALVGLAVVGLAHLIIALDARQDWGLLP